MIFLLCLKLDDDDYVGGQGKVVEKDDSWTPDERATNDPQNFKVDSWSSSLLGKVVLVH